MYIYTINSSNNPITDEFGIYVNKFEPVVNSLSISKQAIRGLCSHERLFLMPHQSSTGGVPCSFAAIILLSILLVTHLSHDAPQFHRIGSSIIKCESMYVQYVLHQYVKLAQSVKPPLSYLYVYKPSPSIL